MVQHRTFIPFPFRFGFTYVGPWPSEFINYLQIIMHAWLKSKCIYAKPNSIPKKWSMHSIEHFKCIENGLTVNEKRTHLMDHLVSLAKCTHKLDSIERLSCVIIHFTHCCRSSSMSNWKTAHGITRSRTHIKYFAAEFNIICWPERW